MLARRLEALAGLFRNEDLRRLEASWTAFYLAEFAYLVALFVYAFERGGTTTVGLVGLWLMVPAALATPLAAALADRLRRERVLLGVQLLRAAALGAVAAAVALGAPAVAVYALAALVAAARAAYRPAHLAVVPELARTPQELVGTNVAASTLEGLATFAGPAVTGVLLVWADVAAAFAFTALVALAGGVLVARIGPRAARPPRASTRVAETAELTAGLRALAEAPDARLVVLLFAAQCLVRGALGVLLVAAAFELLGIGDAGVGYLNAAFGAGAVAGALATVTLVDRHRLARPFELALLLWGAPIALIGLWPSTGPALLALAVVGLGNAILDVSGFTLLQRGTPDEVLGRVFGVLELVAIVAAGAGAAVAPLLLAAGGERPALVVTGLVLPALVLLCDRALVAADARAPLPPPEAELLRAVPLFAPLPLATVEHLAARLAPVDVHPGDVVVEQGAPGERYFLVQEGEVEVVRDGEAIGTLGRGEGFGEIALLRDVPRTATVRARGHARLLALDRDVFVPAVTGNPRAVQAAERLVRERLEAPAGRPA